MSADEVCKWGLQKSFKARLVYVGVWGGMVSGMRQRMQAGGYLPFLVAGRIVNSNFMLLHATEREKGRK